MQVKNFDIFKLALVAILIAFLFLFYQQRDKGRYQFHQADHNLVIDTKTGDIWCVNTYLGYEKYRECIRMPKEN